MATLYLIALSYIAAGIVAYGIAFAYHEANGLAYAALAQAQAARVAVYGWMGLVAALIEYDFGHHGIKFRSDYR